MTQYNYRSILAGKSILPPFHLYQLLTGQKNKHSMKYGSIETEDVYIKSMKNVSTFREFGV